MPGTAAAIESGCRSHARVEPSTSVIRNVTVPVGSTNPPDFPRHRVTHEQRRGHLGNTVWLTPPL